MNQAYFLISLIVIMTLVLIGINFYLITLFTHRDDKGWTKKAVYKIIVILGLTLCQAQTLMIPLDVANVSAIENYLHLGYFWLFVYGIIALFIVFIIPFAIFLYETDDQKSILRRMLTAFAFTSISLIIAIMIVFIS